MKQKLDINDQMSKIDLDAFVLNAKTLSDDLSLLVQAINTDIDQTSFHEVHELNQELASAFGIIKSLKKVYNTKFDNTMTTVKSKVINAGYNSKDSITIWDYDNNESVAKLSFNETSKISYKKTFNEMKQVAIDNGWSDSYINAVFQEEVKYKVNETLIKKNRNVREFLIDNDLIEIVTQQSLDLK